MPSTTRFAASADWGGWKSRTPIRAISDVGLLLPDWRLYAARIKTWNGTLSVGISGNQNRFGRRLAQGFVAAMPNTISVSTGPLANAVTCPRSPGHCVSNDLQRQRSAALGSVAAFLLLVTIFAAKARLLATSPATAAVRQAGRRARRRLLWRFDMRVRTCSTLNPRTATPGGRAVFQTRRARRGHAAAQAPKRRQKKVKLES